MSRYTSLGQPGGGGWQTLSAMSSNTCQEGKGEGREEREGGTEGQREGGTDGGQEISESVSGMWEEGEDEIKE